MIQVLQAQAREYDGADCDIRDKYYYKWDMREANKAHDAEFFYRQSSKQTWSGSIEFLAYEMDDYSSLKYVF